MQRQRQRAKGRQADGLRLAQSVSSEIDFGNSSHANVWKMLINGDSRRGRGRGRGCNRCRRSRRQAGRTSARTDSRSCDMLMRQPRRIAVVKGRRMGKRRGRSQREREEGVSKGRGT